MNESERLKYLRKCLNLKQYDFAERISTTQGHVSDIENGRKSLSDRTIKLIVLQFNVNEDWLRSGIGEPFNEILEDDELVAYCAEICSGTDPFISGAVLEYMRLDDDSKQIIKDLIKKIAEQY
ncbi:MAG: helix-turn-helix transcriptional regulator [Eubacterium sp.]